MIDAGAPYLLDADGTVSDVGWTGGPGGVSYEYPELPPLAPESLQVTGNDQIVTVTWPSRPEADLNSYRLYRGTTSGFWTPGLVPHRETSGADTSLCDTLLTAGESYYYLCTALDTAMLESQPSPEGQYTVTSVFDDPGLSTLPRSPHFRRAYPNPFNDAVVFEIVVPVATAGSREVRIIVYNVLGQQVAIAYEGALGAGETLIRWSPLAGRGNRLSSGVYFAQLYVGGTAFVAPVKIVFMK